MNDDATIANGNGADIRSRMATAISRNDDNGDNTKLKVTYDFGTKGAGTEAADDWGSQYNSRLTALEDAGNWAAIPFTTATSSDHLF